LQQKKHESKFVFYSKQNMVDTKKAKQVRTHTYQHDQAQIIQET